MADKRFDEFTAGTPLITDIILFEELSSQTLKKTTVTDLLGTSGTLQEAFNADPTADPQIDAGANDFNIIGSTFHSITLETATQQTRVELSPIQLNLSTEDTGIAASISLSTSDGGSVVLAASAFKYVLSGCQEFADNAAALVGGLSIDCIYRTGDDLKIVH